MIKSLRKEETSLMHRAKKLISQEVCETNSMSSTVLHQKSIKYGRAFLGVVKLNRNSIKLFTRSSRNKSRSFSISLSLYQINLPSSPQSRYMFDIKRLFEINPLKVIPGETLDDLLRIAINLPKSL